MAKMPINSRYTGKYSGSAGRSYSSSRAGMSGGGGGKGPVNKGGGKKKGCPIFLLVMFLSVTGYTTLIVDGLMQL